LLTSWDVVLMAGTILVLTYTRPMYNLGEFYIVILVMCTKESYEADNFGATTVLRTTNTDIWSHDISIGLPEIEPLFESSRSFTQGRIHTHTDGKWLCVQFLLLDA